MRSIHVFVPKRRHAHHLGARSLEGWELVRCTLERLSRFHCWSARGAIISGISLLTNASRGLMSAPQATETGASPESTRGYSSLAQLAEQATVNRRVPGSSPGAGAKLSRSRTSRTVAVDGALEVLASGGFAFLRWNSRGLRIRGRCGGALVGARGERRASATRGCRDGFSLSLLARRERFSESRLTACPDG